jgi:alkyl sulfatase BDS1-like metallo-beta-lactamase superfamily hydrolase
MSNSDVPPMSMKRANFLRGMISVGVVTGLSAVGGDVFAQGTAPPPKPTGVAAKPPTQATLDANALYAGKLPYDNAQDFADASRGLIATLPD